MRPAWVVGGLVIRGFRRAPLATLLAAAVVLAVVQGWFEPWESPSCNGREPSSVEACG
jgi:hypothetical protein